MKDLKGITNADRPPEFTLFNIEHCRFHTLTPVHQDPFDAMYPEPLSIHTNPREFNSYHWGELCVNAYIVEEPAGKAF